MSAWHLQGPRCLLSLICVLYIFVINQSILITFTRVPVTGDHWCRTSNLMKSIDKKKPMKLTNMSIANSRQVSF